MKAVFKKSNAITATNWLNTHGVRCSIKNANSKHSTTEGVLIELDMDITIGILNKLYECLLAIDDEQIIVTGGMKVLIIKRNGNIL